MDLYLAERLAGLKDPGLVRATSNLAASDLLIHPVEPASFPGTGKAPPWMRPPEADRPEAVPDAGCKQEGEPDASSIHSLERDRMKTDSAAAKDSAGTEQAADEG